MNFSKPCILATKNFPIETVYLNGTSNFSIAVLSAQKACARAVTETDCKPKHHQLSC